MPVPTLGLIALTTLLYCAALQVGCAGAEETNAVERIVFTPWMSAPPGWKKHSDVGNFSATNVFPVHVGYAAQKHFNFLFLVSWFKYTFLAPAPGRYVIRVGIIEVSSCEPGSRVMRLQVNSVSSGDIDVAAVVGCKKPYYIDLGINVYAKLLVTVVMSKVSGARPPGMSNLQLFQTKDRQQSPKASNSTLPLPPRLQTEVTVDAGAVANSVVKGAEMVKFTGKIDTSSARGVPANAFSTALQGADFEMLFSLMPGTYDITLGFVETESCYPGSRIFSVFVNDNVRLEAYDVYGAARACRKARVEILVRQTIDALSLRPLTIRFRGVAGKATVSFVSVKPAANPCIPVTTDATLLSDHLAHAVPGTYPPGDARSYIDTKRLGYVDVMLNGGGSHTHFAYPGGTGKIVSYRWTNAETDELLSTNVAFKHRFSLGTTRLRLHVIDDACTEDEAETSITLSSNIQPGMYCYIYTWMPDLPLPGSLDQWPRPSIGFISKRAKLGFPDFPFYASKFSARCLFFISSGKVSSESMLSLRTFNSGQARLYRGSGLVIDSETNNASAPVVLTEGLNEFELIYRRNDLSRKPRVNIYMGKSILPNIVYDQSTVLPVLEAIDPPESASIGGGQLKITGYGLYLPLKVDFGGVVQNASSTGALSTQVFVVAPPTQGRETVPLRVETYTGVRSNPLNFTYTDTCEDVSFSAVEMKIANGKNVPLYQPTSVVAWQDGSLYIGRRDGFVNVVSYDASKLVVSSMCTSEKITDDRYKKADGTPSERAILGITFDPRDKQPRPYISLCTLFWRSQQQIAFNNSRAWSNGVVARLKPASPETRARNPNQCLEYDQTIVRNLPVSDADHGVNELLFTQEGNLLIAVGGNTNMGLPDGKLGGKWETCFSGSILIARLSRGKNFNGDIPYTTPDSMQTALPIGGYDDVDFYSTGLRNVFSMQMSRDGSIYAIDMGPNCAFGDASSSCDEYDPKIELTRLWVGSFPGRVIVDRKPDGDCKYGPNRPDKLVRIEQGRFYGHSNIQRGLMLNRSYECAWVDPLRGKAPRTKGAPSQYMAPMTMIPSAKTGFREYGANLFCGNLRGDLLLSQNSELGTWRIRLNNKNAVIGSAAPFLPKGGIRVEENVHGDLIFPKYNKQSGIFVSRPNVKNKNGFFVINALPFRHGRAGGTPLTIGGWGFKTDIKVLIGGTGCPVTQVSDTEIVCTVPPSPDRWPSKRIVVTQNGYSQVLEGAILYMKV